MSRRTFASNREAGTHSIITSLKGLDGFTPGKSYAYSIALSIVMHCKHYIQLLTSLKGRPIEGGLELLAASKRGLVLSQRFRLADTGRVDPASRGRSSVHQLAASEIGLGLPGVQFEGTHLRTRQAQSRFVTNARLACTQAEEVEGSSVDTCHSDYTRRLFLVHPTGIREQAARVGGAGKALREFVLVGSS
jgi:hypothetical protein